MAVLNRYENKVFVSEDLDDLLFSELKVRFPRAFFSQAYKEKRWDGYIRFYSKYYHSFSIGLLEEVKELLHKKKVSFDIIDNRGEVKQNNFKCRIELRDYQKRAFDIIKDKDVGIIGLPVNFGKTFLAMKLIEYKNVNTIWIVKNKTLAKQAFEDFKEQFNCEIGFIGDGYNVIKPITVALIQSLTKIKNVAKFSDYFDCCIFDEVHGSSAKTYKKFMESFKTYYRFGLSGTPKSKDAVSVKTVKSLFGDVIINSSQKYLIDMGVSVQPKILMKKFMFEDGLIDKFKAENGIKPTDPISYNDLYYNIVIPNEKRNEFIVKHIKTLLEHKLNVLVITEKVKHGIILNEMVGKGSFVSGKSSSKEIKTALEKFESGEEQLLIATTILDEGINLHSIDAIVIAGAGINSVKTVQRVGRALRTRVGKERAIILDFYDDGIAVVNRQAKKRKSIYYKNFGNVKIV